MLDIGAQGGLVGTVLGMMTADYNDNRQLRQQGKLNEQQMEAQRRMSEFNKRQALDIWEKTGYEAQRRQLEAAGLNVGLMYGGAGAPGQTAGAQAQGPTGGEAPRGGGEIGMGMQMAMQMSLMKAQKENIEADTKVKLRDAGTDTPGKVGEEIKNLAADTDNKRIQGAILKLDQAVRDVEYQVLSGQKEDAISLLNSAARKAYTDAGINEATAPAQIQEANARLQEQALRIAAQEKGLIKTSADIEAVKAGTSKMFQEIRNMVQSNTREWDKLSLENKRQMVEQKIMEIGKQNTDFNTSTPQQIRQWTDLIMSVLTLGIGAQGGSQPAGFKFK